MKPTKLIVAAALSAVLLITPGIRAAGRIVTVTTTNNVAPPAGSTSLAQAIAGLQDGDTINFNIPGAGPHFIATPIGGYALIKANNVTIDGYSQPGSAPNSNPILGGNNAQIKIVIDSRGSESSGDPAKPDRRSTRLPYPGYGDSENAMLGVLGADNLFVRGLSFLGRQSDGSDADPKVYCIALVQEAKNCKVQGCWLGLAPDGTTVGGAGSAVAAFRHRVSVNGSNVDTYSGGLIFGTDGDGVNDVAEFNIAMSMHICLALEAPDVRVSGNYFNVFPDGKTFLDVEALQAEFQALGGDTTVETFENGRVTDNTIIGTNGDGVSDANERNIFAHSVYDHDIEFYSAANNAVIAGNYFGVGVDGTTAQKALTAALPDFAELPGTGSVRIGSNGDGVSDAFEGNLIVGMTGQSFIVSGASVPIVARGNSFVNDSFAAFPFADGANGRAYETYYANALANPAAGAVVPDLAIKAGIMTGTLPVPSTNFSKHVIDVYVLDKVSAANNSVNLPGVWAGSFVEGSALDKDTAPNKFRFSVVGLPIPPGSQVAVAVTYGNSSRTEGTNALTGPLSAPADADIPLFAPGSAESVGLKRIVADTPVISVSADALGNWEPYSSVLGNSTFLIEGNTFAAGTTDKQRYVVALQPADGKPMKQVEGFYADNKAPFTGPINASRQNGNPGRVAGDPRPGAVNYMVGGEASPHTLPEFNSDNRWKLGFDRLADGRYGTVQSYQLDPATLVPTPLSKALDSANGRRTSGDPQGNNQITRFGSDIVGLDNGSFVSVVEDRTKILNPNGNAAVATIFAPDGSVVKESFKIADGDIWSNVAAYRGGFAVRASGVIYFFNNAGALQGSINQDTSGQSYDAGRGDGTRIAGHINSPFVYLAGKVKNASIVKVSVWDSRDRSYVTSADVSEAAFAGDFDRVNLAVDPLDRLVVAWVSKPAEFELEQVAARVLALNAGTKTLAPLTPSFFAFVNAAKSGGIRSLQMSPAITTKQIMIAAKGEINLANKPAEGANSNRELNFYTVLSHPDPKEDPTAPVGAPKNIIFVSFHATDSPSAAATTAGFTQAPDIGYTQLLKANGYNVTRYLTRDIPEANVLNAADLVIISRSVPSGNYELDAETAAWNGITAPTMVLGGYIIRQSRLGYMAGSTIPDAAGPIRLAVNEPSHPIFAGVPLAGSTMVNPYSVLTSFTNAAQRGISVVTGATAGNGKVLATVGTTNDPAFGGMVIGEWNTGAVLSTSPADTLGGHRLVLLTGSREKDGLTSEGAGIYDLTDDGAKLFLNAVKYMLQPANPKLSIGKSGSQVTITWTAGRLQQASSITGPWADVANAASPLSVTPAGVKFYRAAQ